MRRLPELLLLVVLVCGSGVQAAPDTTPVPGLWTAFHAEERQYPHWETSMLGEVGFQPGDSLFDGLTDLLVSQALDNPHTATMFAHLTESPEALGRATNRLAHRVLEDQDEYRAGRAKNRHIHHAGRRLGLSVLMQLKERAGGVCSTFACDDDSGQESEGEVGQVSFVDSLPTDVSDDADLDGQSPAREQSITVNDDLRFMTARWGRCRATTCSRKHDYGLHGCYVPDTNEFGPRSVLLGKAVPGFPVMKRIFGATLKEQLPNCACSVMKKMGLAHVGVYMNRSPDTNPEETSHVQALCFSVNALEDYEGARPICQKDLRDLEIYEEDRRTRACMCFNTKDVVDDGRKWHEQPWKRILLSSNDAHKVSDRLGLGCTHYFRGWPESLSNFAMDDHPGEGDEADGSDDDDGIDDSSVDGDASEEQKQPLTPAQKISKLWAGQKSHVKGLLSTFKEFKDLFLWQLKLNVFPAQSLQLVLMCSDISKCMSLVIQFGRGLMLFMARLVFDVIRIFWYALQWISPTLARVMARVGQSVTKAARAAAMKVYNAYSHRDRDDKLAMGGFDPVGMDLDELVNMAGLTGNEPDWSLKGSADALEEASVCDSCNAVLAFAATLPSLDVWGTLMKAISLDLVAVAIAGQPMPSFQESFLLKPCSKCLRKTYRVTAKSVAQVNNYVKDYSNSCNLHSVGMCYLLAVQRRVSHIAKTRLKTMPFEKDPTFFRCDAFPGIYIDLYRTESQKNSAFYSDIHCGTPPGTQTPGMKFGDVCKYVHKKVKKEWVKPKSYLFSLEDHAKWDEFNDCLELFQCEVPTEESFQVTSIEKKVRAKAKERVVAEVRERILETFHEVDLDANSGAVERAISLQKVIFEEMKNAYNREVLVEESDLARATIDQQWKRNPYQLFTNNKWARPECVNVRGMVTRAQMDYGVSNRELYRKMMLHQERRFKEINRKKSLFWSPIFDATCRGMKPEDQNRASFFTEVFCKLEKAQDIVMRKLVHIQEKEAQEMEARRHYGSAEQTFSVLAKHYARDWNDDSYSVTPRHNEEDRLLREMGFAGSSNFSPTGDDDASDDGAAPDVSAAPRSDGDTASSSARTDVKDDSPPDASVDTTGKERAGLRAR